MSGKIRNTINARQIKAARALLDWSQEQLAETCGLSIATIRKIESGHISPRNSTMDGIQRALEGAGLEFIDPSGVRERLDEIRVYEGREGFIRFFDEVYHSAMSKGGEFVCVCESETDFTKALGAPASSNHIFKMGAISGRFTFKCLLTEDTEDMCCSSYCSYRTISKQLVDSVPFYIFEDKYAIIIFEALPEPKIIIVQSQKVADAFRRQFHSMWEKATPLNPPPSAITAPGQKSKK